MGKKISSYIDGNDNKGYHFKCPGCNSVHNVFVEGKGVPVWNWNKNVKTPTFSPSVKVEGYLGKDLEGNPLYGVCHSFVKNGNIQFLNDCSHHLKGQTVEIPDWD